MDDPESPIQVTVESYETTTDGFLTGDDPSPPTKAVDIAHWEELWRELRSLYSANEQMKTDPAVNPSSNPTKVADFGKKLEGLLNKFMDGVNVFLDVLQPLGQAHPIFGVAISAFNQVVKLDIARRDNNKKVLVVVMQMQSVMGPLFRLQNLNRDHMPQAERDSHEGRLKELMAVIVQNITACRSTISYFVERNSVVKLVLAKRYERKWAMYIDAFARRRSELESLISEYLAIGASSANATLFEYGKTLEVVDSKIDMIISMLFRGLDTPREREVFKFTQQNGGLEKCINDLDLFPKFMSKAGESIHDQKGLQDAQKQLREALMEDLDEVLERHYLRFEKMLQVQSNNILRTISANLENQGKLVQGLEQTQGQIFEIMTRVMTEGVQMKAAKLKDPEINRVWNRMNLGTSSVKAKLFVLTFRDHIRPDNSNPSTPVVNVKRPRLPGERPDSDSLHPPAPDKTERDSDDWVLDYIDVAHVQPIVEAMDEDGSGFISVKEANSFATARPGGLSLLHWIAYWAAGWHLNLETHKKAIYSILLEMLEVLPSIHVANRAWVDSYIDDTSLRRVEALLRSIKPLPHTTKKEPQLTQVANIVASDQLDRLQKNINDLGYSIESSADATVIGGSARVEIWILPLLLLLLKRHLQIIYLAKSIVLDATEFKAHIKSLSFVFAVFDERKENLEAKFRQLHRDIDAQFQKFSYGMFHAAFKKTELNALENTLLSLKMDDYDDYNSKQSISIAGQSHDLSILSKPVGRVLPYAELDFSNSDPMPDDHVPRPLEGSWCGWFEFMDRDSSWRLPVYCVIQPYVDTSFVGKGEGYSMTFEFTNGKVLIIESSNRRIGVTFDCPDLDITYQGTYDTEREVIEGTLFKSVKEKDTEEKQDDSDGGFQGAASTEVKESEIQEAKPVAGETEGAEQPQLDSVDDDAGEELEPNCNSVKEGLEVNPAQIDDYAAKDSSIGCFRLTRNPPDIVRFRYLLDGPGPIPCWNLWPMTRKRWAFATEAILFRTRLRMGSRKAFKLVLAERRKWLTFGIRADLTDSYISNQWSKYEPLSDQEWEEYTSMEWMVHPTIARLYETLGHYLMSRDYWSVGLYCCDACKKSIAFTRYHCIFCMTDDLSLSVDLCDKCFDKPHIFRGADNVIHTPSHSLIRSRQRVHALQAKPLIIESRLISERCKSIFHVLDKAKTKELSSRTMTKRRGAKTVALEIDHSVASATNDVQAPVCACCTEPMFLPCWVCILCSPLTFICDRCDNRNAPVVQIGRNHAWHHRLLRIHNSNEVKPVKTNEMERQLEQITVEISSLKNQMKVVVDGVAKTAGAQDDDLFTTPLEIDNRSDIGEATKVPKQVKAEVETEDEDVEAPSQSEIQPRALSEEDTSGRLKSDIVNAVKSQMELGTRVSALETMMESMNKNNQSLEDRYATLGTKMDSLEAKMDQQHGSLLTLMEQILWSSLQTEKKVYESSNQP